MRKFDERLTKLLAYIEEIKRNNQPLPSYQGAICYKYIAQAAGIPDNYFSIFPELCKYVIEASNQVGVFVDGNIINPDEEKYKLYISYNELQELGQRILSTENISLSSIPSYNSTLNKWKAFWNVQDTGNAVIHFTDNFEDNLIDFSKSIKHDKSAISRLRKWYEIFSFLYIRKLSEGEKFSDILYNSIGKDPKKLREVAEKADIPISTLRNWLIQRNNPTDLIALNKLEEALNVTQGSLTKHIPNDIYLNNLARRIPNDWWPREYLPGRTRTSNIIKRAVVHRLSPSFFLAEKYDREKFEETLKQVSALDEQIDYRESLKKLIRKKYHYKMKSWTGKLLDEFQEFATYKTELDELSPYDGNGTWKSQSTTERHVEILEGFFGFLLLSKNNDVELSGKGMSPEDLSIALLTQPSLIEDYIRFKKNRSKKFHGGIKTFLLSAISYLTPNSGWIWLNPWLSERLSPEIQGEITRAGGWHQYCAACRNQITNLDKRLIKNDAYVQSRKPFEPIMPILESKQPVLAIFNALKITQAQLNLKFKLLDTISKNNALEYRNFVIISLMSRLPLRSKHWGMFTYKTDNTGYLRKDKNGNWYLVIPYKDFKNHSNKLLFPKKSGRQEIARKLSGKSWTGIKEILDFYVENCLPIISTDNDYLFPNGERGKLTQNLLYHAVYSWSLEYLSDISPYPSRIPRVKAFGPHSFRDILATHILKTSKYGGLELAAAALFDNVETVRKHYVLQLPEDLLERVYENVNFDALQEMELLSEDSLQGSY